MSEKKYPFVRNAEDGCGGIAVCMPDGHVWDTYRPDYDAEIKEYLGYIAKEMYRLGYNAAVQKQRDSHEFI